ncbi:monovalent cation:H+ antiporter, CPA1 family [Mariprofundus aestuarium]|uniref:Monovalent cation:H+ antiporter, CPA1 family n=1 Tax=Mariprofundus aestuarium TaxID=1921086 RepID=A0A2K8KW54_MARES|nr:cation:proton antiporter [Mariprofundus aestuarium]ATX79023.1 monovalent cation:H+ antiporter, CPA1 family [Mariprofundus aestuarium]
MEHTSLVSAVVWSIFSLLLVALFIQFLAQRIRLPFTILLVLVGIGLNSLHDLYPGFGLFQALKISPDIILYIFLPALIFESSYNLDARRLIHNIGPVMTLAVPGLLISTFVIGTVLWWATAMPFTIALLLGAILSATDPVAVVSIFRQIGAPDRLNTLIEGESLFNDATSIVVAGILVGMVIEQSGEVSIGSGIASFFILFLGGLVVGITLGYLTGKIIGWIESESFIEIGLTTALAYLSFLLAEEIFHVSGVMATVGAGLTLGSWGRIRISTSVRIYLEHFWELLAFIANALLFLLVGMKVDLNALWQTLDKLAWVVFAMLVARAIVVFCLMPLIGRLPGSRPISFPYQFIMFWGGLRGAIALAIVLSLPHFEYSELFVAMVMGAVLFTLLVQGLSIESVMKKFGLDIPPLADRFAIIELDLASKRRAMKQLPRLKGSGFFSSRIAHNLTVECDHAISNALKKIDHLRATEMDRGNELNLLYLRALTEEKSFYTEMYNHGHISEGAARELSLVLNMQIDALRYNGAFEHVHSHRIKRALEQSFFRLTTVASWLMPIAERMRMSRIILDYEQIWAHFLGSSHVIKSLGKLAKMDLMSEAEAEEVINKYRSWHEIATHQLYQVSEQYPEFVTSMQNRMGQRMLLLAELETTEEKAEQGVLPEGVAKNIEAALAKRLSALRGQEMEPIHDDPLSMIRRVPLFSELDSRELGLLSELVQRKSLLEHEFIVQKGVLSEILIIIVRGVLRITFDTNGKTHEGTLVAGEFFGEKALMGHSSEMDSSSTVGVEAVIPCIVHIISRESLQELLEEEPALADKLAARDRELRESSTLTQ